MPPDSTPTSDLYTNAKTAGTDNNMQYTREEITKLKPTPTLPISSLQPDVQAPGEAVNQDSTTADAATTDIKIEAEQQSDLRGETEIAGSDEGKVIQAPNETANVEKNLEENGEAVQSTEGQVADADRAAPLVGEVEKKKKKKKSSGKNRKPNPTGFEEFYADPPITPEEYAEEKEELYH